MKMENRSLSNIYLSTFLSIAATGGGWALAGKMAGHEAAMSFLYISVPIITAALIIQTLLFFKSRGRAKFLVLLNIASAFGVMWMMSCLVLPLFWIGSVGLEAKLLFGSCALILCSLNIARGIRNFGHRWEVTGEKLLKKYYSRGGAFVDWNGIVSSLKLSVSLYFPGIPEAANPVLTIVLVISMLAGYSLRNVVPVFSIFAWGIPSVMVVAVVMQMIGFGIGQFLVLVALEKADRNIIRPL